MVGAPFTLGAVEARRLIGAGRLSSVELVSACIGRIEAVNDPVNAFVATCFERALAEARAADNARSHGEPLGPLHGLPIAIKDNTATEGVRTTYGSPLYRDNVPDRDAHVVARIRQAGAIILGKTNVPEFSAGANTTNEVYGPTRNPFDLSRTAGGSSGGSAVALALNMVPLATGTDSGGSLRVPAGFCGIVAHRGTPGLVPSDTRPVLLTMSHVPGPMARNVADVTLLLSVMAGRDAADPLSTDVDAARLRRVTDIDLSTLRVGTSEDLGFAPVANATRSVFRRQLGIFARSFRQCDECDPDLATAFRVFRVFRGIDFLAAHKARYDASRDGLGPFVRDDVESGLATTGEAVGWAHAEHARLFRNFQGYFDGFDVLICPAVAVPPFAVEKPYCDEIDGCRLDYYIEWLSLNAALTMTGHPVAVIPCGTYEDGMPFGLQICGPHRADRHVLSIALALERLFESEPALRRPIPNDPVEFSSVQQ